MRWIEFARMHGGDAVAGLPGVALRRVADAIDGGRDIVEIAREEAARPDGGLPPAAVQRLFDIEEKRRRWQDAATSLAARRQDAGLPPLGEALVAAMGSADSVLALGRAADLAPSATAAELREIAAAWDACFSLAWRGASVRAVPAGGFSEQDVADRYTEAIGKPVSPDAMPARRWPAIRRGEREGAIDISMDLPLAAMEEWVREAAPRFGRAAEERPAGEILRAVVLVELPEAVFRQMDELAEREAMEAAGRAYAALFKIPPVRAARLAAVFFGRGPRPVSWAIVGDDGAPIASGAETGRAGDGVEAGGQDDGDGWAAALIERLREAGAEALVLPNSSQPHERLDAVLGAATGRLPVTRVPTIAIREGKASLDGPEAELPSGQACAVVLARRALDPVRSFASVDPVSLCDPEYRDGLDPARVGSHLLVARALAGIEAERAAAARSAQAAARPQPHESGQKASPSGTAQPSGGQDAAGPLHSLTMTVASIDDVRPGMRLTGVVTKLTTFGAFVGIGLRQDGLIHLSEMSDEHVTDPSKLLKTGQQVHVRVVSVDRSRNRISLSMRTESARPPRREAKSERPRSAALRELDKLFKK